MSYPREQGDPRDEPADERPDEGTYDLAETHEDEPAADGHEPRRPVPPAAPIASGVRCVRCGYDLSGTPLGGLCPECGTPVAETVARLQRTTDGSSPAAVTCLVLGVVSIGCCSFTGPFAIYFYSRAQGEIAAGGYSSGSHTMAVVGLILGILGTGLMALQAVTLVLGWA